MKKLEEYLELMKKDYNSKTAFLNKKRGYNTQLIDEDEVISGAEVEDTYLYTSSTLQEYRDTVDQGDIGYDFQVEEQVGGEDQGSDYHIIIGVYTLDSDPVRDEAEAYIKFEGYYNSWEGTEWENSATKLVTPHEERVIVYR